MRNAPSKTAELVALFRAAEQRHEPADRIVDDRFARLFLTKAARAALTAYTRSGLLGAIIDRHATGLFAYVLARHRFIDEALAHALARSVDPVEQLVLLGAGYDTRAYRFSAELGGRPVFEVDFPATSRRKAAIVARNTQAFPSANIRVVEIDFTKEALEARLRHAGFQPGKRTFFIWEGVSMYLSRETIQTTLSTIHALGQRGTELAMDFWFRADTPGLTGVAQRASIGLLSLVGEPATFSLPAENAGAFLERLGFRVTDLAGATELSRRFIRGRRPVYPSLYVLHAESTERSHPASPIPP